MKKFTCVIEIHLSDTDASGAIFFPKIFEKCLIVQETFLKQKGIPSAFLNQNMAFPVVCCNSHYFIPIHAYQELIAEMVIEKIGNTSITFCYQFFNQQTNLVAEAKVVHVCMDREKNLKKSLPQELLAYFRRDD